MALGESFRTYPTFTDREVFESVGRIDRVIELKPSNFEGPVAHWANDRMRKFGETIVPKQVYIEQPPYKKPHRVAWIYHAWEDKLTGESNCMHHIACDCSGDIERAGTEEERNELVSACPALIPVLEKQADVVDATYHISDVLNGLPIYGNLSMEEQSPEVQHFIARSIVVLLDRNYRHPQDWIANVESGWTLTNLMARIFKITVEDVEWLAEGLSIQDSIELVGRRISLTEEQKELAHRQREYVEMSKRLDKIIDESLQPENSDGSYQ